MVILRNEKLRRSWAGKRPSTVKEGEMQPAGEGNRVHDGSQGNEGSPVQSRQPSKRNAAKALDPAFAYQPVKKTKSKISNAKQPDEQTDEQSLRSPPRATRTRQPPRTPPSPRTPLSRRATLNNSSPETLRVVQKLIDARRANNLSPNRLLNNMKNTLEKKIADEEHQKEGPVNDNVRVQEKVGDGHESTCWEEEEEGATRGNARIRAEEKKADERERVSDEEDQESESGEEDKSQDMDLMGGKSQEQQEESEEEEELEEEEEELEDDEELEEDEVLEEDGEGEQQGESGDSSSSDEDEAPQPQKKKGRGEAKMLDNRPFDQRPKLYVIGERAFSSRPYDNKIVTTIAQLVKRNVNGPYATYGEFPEDTQKEIMRAFLMKYRWANSKKKREQCSDVFHRIARCRYSNILTNLRRDVTKKAQNSDPVSWKPFPPRWINHKHWVQMCDYWASPAWQKKSAQMRDNRVKTGVHVYHRQGRANSYALQRSMGEKLKRNVTYAEVYVETRMKKDKEGFLSEKAGVTWDKYKTLMSKKYGDKEWPSFDTEVWCEASGGKKNGYYYGVPAIMDSANLPGGRKKGPVMDNILPSGSNSQDEDEDEDEDEEEDPTYKPPKKKSKKTNSRGTKTKKVRPEIFEQDDYEEELIEDFDVVSSDSYESESDDE